MFTGKIQTVYGKAPGLQHRQEAYQPPLRQRGNDVLLLARHFLNHFCAKKDRHPMQLDDTTRRILAAYAWPGNVRELENCIKRAVIMADGNQITLDDVGLNEVQEDQEICLDLRLVREQAEKGVIIAALARSDGNVLKAAEMLGVSRPTLYDLMHRYGLK